MVFSSIPFYSSFSNISDFILSCANKGKKLCPAFL